MRKSKFLVVAQLYNRKRQSPVRSLFDDGLPCTPQHFYFGVSTLYHKHLTPLSVLFWIVKLQRSMANAISVCLFCLVLWQSVLGSTYQCPATMDCIGNQTCSSSSAIPCVKGTIGCHGFRAMAFVVDRDSISFEGMYCPGGSEPGYYCKKGYYCPTPTQIIVCPGGSYCPTGSYEPYGL